MFQTKFIALLMTWSYPVLEVRASISRIIPRLPLLLGHQLRATEASEETFFIAYNFVIIKWEVNR